MTTTSSYTELSGGYKVVVSDHFMTKESFNLEPANEREFTEQDAFVGAISQYMDLNNATCIAFRPSTGEMMTQNTETGEFIVAENFYFYNLAGEQQVEADGQ